MTAAASAADVARAVDLVRHGGESVRRAAAHVGISARTLDRALKGEGSPGAAVAAAMAGGLAGVGRPPPRPTADEPPDSWPPTDGDAVALPEARRALARAHQIRESLPRSASLAERRTAEKLVQDAITTLTKCEAARELTPAEVLRSPAWRRVEAVVVAAAATVPGAAAAIGRALEQLAKEGG